MRSTTPTTVATVAALVSTAACIAQSPESQPPVGEPPPAVRYGQAGSLALDLSAAWATDLDDGNYWMPLSIGVSWFAADGFSLDASPPRCT